MSPTMDTRRSLVLRLRDRDDEVAWSDFIAVYEPVIYGLARKRGFQDADAREVTQEVLLSVSAAIDRFDPDASGSFAGWLSRITRNAAIDKLRKREAIGTGGSTMCQVLRSVPGKPESNGAADALDSPTDPTTGGSELGVSLSGESLPGVSLPGGPSLSDAEEFDVARRRQLFLWAAAKIKPRFSKQNWDAFWLTAVDDKPADEVAKLLGIGIGAVYVARCRILARLREVVQTRSQE